MQANLVGETTGMLTPWNISVFDFYYNFIFPDPFINGSIFIIQSYFPTHNYRKQWTLNLLKPVHKKGICN